MKLTGILTYLYLCTKTAFDVCQLFDKLKYGNRQEEDNY